MHEDIGGGGGGGTGHILRSSDCQQFPDSCGQLAMVACHSLVCVLVLSDRMLQYVAFSWRVRTVISSHIAAIY